MEILETLEDERSIAEPPTGELVTEEVLVKATITGTINTKVVPPETVSDDMTGSRMISPEAVIAEVPSIEAAAFEIAIEVT